MEGKKLEIFKAYIALLRTKKGKGVPSKLELLKIYSRGEIEYSWPSLKVLEVEALKKYPNLFPEGFEPGKRRDVKIELVKRYIELKEKLGKLPDLEELLTVLSRDQLNKNFKGGIKGLESVARADYPTAFNDIAITKIRTPKALREMRSSIKKHKRFFIVTAVTGCEVHRPSLKSIKQYCKKMDAQLLVLVSSDPARRKDPDGYEVVDRILASDPDITIILEDTMLNSNFHLSTLKLSAKQIDPVTGLDALGQNNGSFVYGSPKQRLKVVPVGTDKFAHVIMTPGAITVSDYNTEMFMSLRTAAIAEDAHVMGGLIVEIASNKRYYHRYVQFDEDGKFIDLSMQYDGSKTEFVPAISLTCGDWHTGDTCPNTKKATREICSVLKPRYMILHDYFDALSANHHEHKDVILQAQRAESDEVSIEKETDNLARESEDLATFDVEEFIVVFSNHDDFLSRYLRAGNFIKNALNLRILFKLGLAMLDDKNPVQYAHDVLAECKVKEKFRWLKEDEDFILAGIQHGAHGHLGANGSRNPGIKGLHRNYGNSNTGHSHTPEIYGGAWRAGTSTPRRVRYTKGPGSWLNAHIVTYPNGSRQMIFMIDGDWRL